MRKGIILAAGSGTRLHPLTIATGKQLLPVYDKPMVYYPLTVLMLAGIDKILVISTERDLGAYSALLQDGAQWGISIEFAVQDEPRGLADAFLVGEEFVSSDPVALILGDNILYGSGLGTLVRKAAIGNRGATILAYHVRDPERYGVVELGPDGSVSSIEEKPTHPRSNYAVPGLYFYDSEVVDIARHLHPSERGELEITDVNLEYLKRGFLDVFPLPRGIAWLDAGTHESLHQASSFVQTVQERQGMLIASPEEVAVRMGLISRGDFEELAVSLGKGAYGEYLRAIASDVGDGPLTSAGR
jgi:glucose-1-phosphate thymidylyltransferase